MYIVHYMPVRVYEVYGIRTGAVCTVRWRSTHNIIIICYIIIIIYYIIYYLSSSSYTPRKRKRVYLPIPPCTGIHVKVFPSILYFASSRPDPERSLRRDILLLLCDDATRRRFLAGLPGSTAVEIILCIYIYIYIYK